MKKTIKKLLLVLIAIISLTAFTSCNHANTYQKFNNNSSNLSKSHVIKEIDTSDLKSLMKKLDKNKKIKGQKVVETLNDEGDVESSYTYIYIFLGTPTDSTASTYAQVFDEQAKQYEIECLYWIDTDLSEKKIEKLNSILKNSVQRLENSTSGLISIRRETSKEDLKCEIYFDSTDVEWNTKDGKAGSTELTHVELAQMCFKNQPKVNSK